MNLKEAFQYNNYLNKMYTNALGFLSTRTNVMSTKEYHYHSKMNPEHEDEVLDVEYPETYDCEPDRMLCIALEIMEERMALTRVIGQAKCVHGFDFDSAIAINRIRREMVNALNIMTNFKAREFMKSATGYKFNAEGNQVPYVYQVKEVSTAGFDRERVKNEFRKLNEEANGVSNDIDKYLLETEFYFEPKYALTDSLEDIIEAHKNK